MAEVWFYQLMRASLEATLPTLVVRARARNWRVAIRVGSMERLTAVDDLLWTYSDDSFLAHGTDAELDPETQPVLLTLEDGAKNGAEVLFLIDGAPLPKVWPQERVIMLFDGRDPDAIEAARGAWREAKGLGHGVQFWQQDEDGRWQRKS